MYFTQFDTKYNKRLYCAFVDLKKAFDSVYHNALWFKLYKMGINVTMLRMYDTVKCCVKKKKVREKSRECHNHKLQQPFPDTKRKRNKTKQAQIEQTYEKN